MTPGGRGGQVIAVTNLNENGPGSLRAAVNAEGPRMVIFRVSGVITLETELTINNPFITIAGQSAPGDGICIRGQTTEINTHDVILRYLRFRRGNLKDRNDTVAQVRASSANPAPHVTWQPAEEAYELVLKNSGATLPKRDPVDERIIQMVRTGQPAEGNGIIDMPNEVGGWPEYQSKPAPKDHDHDGMPDVREKEHDLNMEDSSDAREDADEVGYTNIEEWLNGTNPTQYVDYTKPVNNKNSLHEG